MSKIEPLPFWEMIEYMRGRGVVLPDIYYGRLYGIQRANSFSVAGISAVDQLEQIQDSLVEAMTHGQSYEDWKALVKSGEISLDLPEWRYEVIYRTNIQSMYNRGRLSEQRMNQAYEPYLMYDAVGDSRTRPSHKALDGTIRHINDPFWKKYAPSNGYNCRCQTIGLSEEEAMERGGETRNLPDVEPDKGWDYSVLDQPHKGAEEAIRKRKKWPILKHYLPKVMGLEEVMALGKTKRVAYDSFIQKKMSNGLTWTASHNLYIQQYVKKYAGIPYSKVKPFAGSKGKQAKELAELASMLFPRSWIRALEKAKFGLAANFVTSRGYYMPSERRHWLGNRSKTARKWLNGGYDVIEGGNRGLISFIHEFAHFIQHAFPDLQYYFAQLHYKKTSGQALVEEVKNEFARKDHYPNWYFGKEMGHLGPVELMTMSLESILTGDKIGFKLFTEEQNRDITELVLGLLYGWKP